ncbi:MAG: hypothetical protein J3K34DRAFT_195148 [Monoraphidium minutum]|nr:MAG: hypothetical protein J3K34DRAFT_195148 [Monoraphidium minutum]
MRKATPPRGKKTRNKKRSGWARRRGLNAAVTRRTPPPAARCRHLCARRRGGPASRRLCCAGRGPHAALPLLPGASRGIYPSHAAKGAAECGGNRRAITLTVAPTRAALPLARTPHPSWGAAALNARLWPMRAPAGCLEADCVRRPSCPSVRLDAYWITPPARMLHA